MDNRFGFLRSQPARDSRSHVVLLFSDIVNRRSSFLCDYVDQLGRMKKHWTIMTLDYFNFKELPANEITFPGYFCGLAFKNSLKSLSRHATGATFQTKIL